MSEIMPCGLEAYGVFIFTDQAEGEVPDCLEALVGVLPEQLLAVRDPLVFLRVKGKLKGNQSHKENTRICCNGCDKLEIAQVT